MFYRLLVFLLLLSQPLLAVAGDAAPRKANVVMETTMGTVKLELFDDKAPITCANFRRYVNEGFFNGLIFHRVIPGFVVQGGGFEPGMKKRNTHEPIVNEADNGLKNSRGTLSMARTQDIYSATSQFFINTVDNAFLDQRDTSPAGFGYAVFGKVVDGMNVVDKIGNAPTGMRNRFSDVPVETVTIKSVKRLHK